MTSSAVLMLPTAATLIGLTVRDIVQDVHGYQVFCIHRARESRVDTVAVNRDA